MNNISNKKLPISIGILSRKSNLTLINTLNSYVKNNLFDIVDDVTIFFQEISQTDIEIANQFNCHYIGNDNNIGIGAAFLQLAKNSRNKYILLLEHDWELIEDQDVVFTQLKQGIIFLELGYSTIRYRHRKYPGHPLYTLDVYQGKELEHYDPVIDLISPHLIDSIHWINNPHELFNDKIQKIGKYFVTTSRWANFTNNPCLYKKEFYINIINEHKKTDLLLENDISHWWARQDFKVIASEGLFTHNDIDKYH